MSVRPSLGLFPVTGSLKDESGLPWGATISPLSQEVSFSVPHEGSALATEIPRCDRCYSYVNPFVTFQPSGWRCSLCGNENAYEGERYVEAAMRRTLPEVSNAAIDYLMEPCPVHRPIAGDPDPDRPIFLAVVDISGSDNGLYLQKIQECLFAVLEAIPETALFGLVTFSDRVGVWDLRQAPDSAPHVSNLPIPENYECYVSIDQIIDFDQFLVPVGQYLASITGAIEQLGERGTRTTRRGLGATMQLLVEYFNLFNGLSARLLLFSGGIANYGIGAVPLRSVGGKKASVSPIQGLPQKGTPQPSATSLSVTPLTPFYRDLAKSAVDSGLCVDMLFFPLEASETENLGLSSTKFLSLFTGGNVSIYNSTILSETNAAKDVYRRYSGPLAFHSLLRLRTSPEFAVSEMYGHVQADPNYDDLYHMQGCDQWKSFAVDFEFTSPSGFFRMAGGRKPTLQMAFAYSFLDSKENGGQFVERRLRIQTLQVASTSSHAELYSNVDSGATMSLLVHKIGRIALDESVKEAKLYLQDWMTIVYSRYNETVVIPSASIASGPQGHKDAKQLIRATNVDLHFHKFPGMKPVPRLVFALLKSPLLRTALTPDFWTYIHCFYTGCGPEALRLLVYPRMAAYGAVNNLSHDNVNLSQTSLQSSGNHLFLLDAFSTVYIFFDSQSTEQFPPSKETLIWKHAKAESNTRFITPKVSFVRGGTAEEEAFQQLLIEDVTRTGMSYTHFLEACSRAVVEMAKR